MVAQKISGNGLAWTAAVVMGSLALILWYGIGYWNYEPSKKNRTASKDQQDEAEMSKEGTPLTDKIKQVLTETRMVLPGTQALLGFQVIIFLMEAFDRLPGNLKWMHFASLVAVAVSAMLLIAPAAFHRIAEHGEDSDRFHRVASKFMLSAMFFLGLGLAGDFFVITWKVSHSQAWASWSAGMLLLFFYGLWFGYSGWKRLSER
jgi:O-antigen/teichoic acid export membrane protein